MREIETATTCNECEGAPHFHNHNGSRVDYPAGTVFTGAVAVATKRPLYLLIQADVALAAAQNDQGTIETWMLEGETHEECKYRLIAEARAALAAAGE